LQQHIELDIIVGDAARSIDISLDATRVAVLTKKGQIVFFLISYLSQHRASTSVCTGYSHQALGSAAFD
jgi:hypothetical protein